MCEMVSHCSFDLLFSNDVEHHITCLFAICISSLEKCLLKLFPMFHLVCFFWLLSFRNSLHIPDSNPLSSTCLCKALLAHTYTHLFAYCPCCSPATSEFRYHTEKVTHKSQKYLLSDPLQKKCAGTCPHRGHYDREVGFSLGNMRSP